MDTRPAARRRRGRQTEREKTEKRITVGGDAEKTRKRRSEKRNLLIYGRCRGTRRDDDDERKDEETMRVLWMDARDEMRCLAETDGLDANRRRRP